MRDLTVVIILAFVIIDALVFFLVPRTIRENHPVSVIPGGGFALYAAYHFGNKLNLTEESVSCKP